LRALRRKVASSDALPLTREHHGYEQRARPIRATRIVPRHCAFAAHLRRARGAGYRHIASSNWHPGSCFHGLQRATSPRSRDRRHAGARGSAGTSASKTALQILLLAFVAALAHRIGGDWRQVVNTTWPILVYATSLVLWLRRSASDAFIVTTIVHALYNMAFFAVGILGRLVFSET